MGIELCFGMEHGVVVNFEAVSSSAITECRWIQGSLGPSDRATLQ